MSNVYAEHLQGVVQFSTVSYVDKEKVDYAQFDLLHQYLEKTWPLVHKTLEKKIIGRANLLYKWKGKHADKLPVLLMAHQDVVPEGEHTLWKYPPYAGIIAEGYVWGRGANDCKSKLVVVLDAVEELIQEGFEPDYDIYLAFSEDEEVQGEEKGARSIAEYLKEKNVRLGAVFDEGGGLTKEVTDDFDGYVASVSLAEKAYNDYELYVEGAGGHSSRPGKGTSLGQVAKAIVAVEENPLPYKLTEIVENQLKAESRLYEGERKQLFENPRANFEKLQELAKDDALLDALLHSTTAATMASGSTQSNVIPARASAIVNARVLPGDTKEQVLEHLKEVVPSGVKVRQLVKEDVAPISKSDTREFLLIKEILEKIHGKEVLLIPKLVVGGTDARFYTLVSDNVFRFYGIVRKNENYGIHGIDERIEVDALSGGVLFLKEYLRNY